MNRSELTEANSQSGRGALPTPAKDALAVASGLECVGYALAAYAAERGTRLADLTDILTDLLHFADQGGEDCEALVRNALWNWRNER